MLVANKVQSKLLGTKKIESIWDLMLFLCRKYPQKGTPNNYVDKKCIAPYS